MTSSKINDDWRNNTKPVLRKHIRFYQVLGASALCLAIVLFAYNLTAADRQEDFKLNFLTEMLGVLITVLAVGAINVWWNERQQLEELKVQSFSNCGLTLEITQVCRIRGLVSNFERNDYI